MRTPLLLTIIIFMGGMSSGCGTSQERIDAAKQAIPYVQELSKALDGPIAELRLTIEQTQKAMSDPNLTAAVFAKFAEGLAATQARLEKAQADKAQYDGLLVKLNDIASRAPSQGADAGDELKLVGESLLAGSPYLPAAAKGLAAGIGTLLVVVAGAFARNASAFKKAMGEIVADGEKLKAAQPEIKPAFKEAYSDQSQKTKELVALARARLPGVDETKAAA